MRFLAALLITVASLHADEVVKIRIDSAKKIGKFPPIYSYFGYDEPNFTYADNGQKLVKELAALNQTPDDRPVYIRTHFMLASGNGSPRFKFGSTNVYTEGASRKAIYDWTIVDRIIDTYVKAGAKPFVEIGFMPKALSTKPDPYEPDWSPGSNFNQYYLGWTYPPKDYAKWSDLVREWVRHSVEKYGKAEVESWYWEVWNEPDIGYWHGTPEEFDKLYDYTADAVKHALPTAKIGGPVTTGPANERAAAFLRQFLEHCATGTNFATGTTGTPLDFITYHAKGRPAVVDGHVQMGISKNAEDVERGFQIVREFPKFLHLPIVLSESDPEGCAACSARVYPQNAYRNGALYPAYTAVMMKNLFELADRAGTNIAGMLTWAFEFENQPYFDGFRTLATNGIDKPILNLFRMMGMMRGDRVKVESSGAVDLKTMLKSGVRDKPDVDAFAVGADRSISLLVWNYYDDDVPAPPAKVRIEVDSVPNGLIVMNHYQIDATHSNAWTAWKKMGSPQHPSPAEYAALEEAGHLKLMGTTRMRRGQSDSTPPKYKDQIFEIDVPRQGVVLIQLNW